MQSFKQGSQKEIGMKELKKLCGRIAQHTEHLPKLHPTLLFMGQKLFYHLNQIPSLRISIQEGVSNQDNVRLRLEELEALDEKRLEAQQRLECYQACISRTFNKKVCPRSFQVGDLVLVVRRPIIITHRTKNKFVSKWDEPYVVQEAYTNGTYKLVAEDGLRIGPINGKFLLEV